MGEHGRLAKLVVPVDPTGSSDDHSSAIERTPQCVGKRPPPSEATARDAAPLDVAIAVADGVSSFKPNHQRHSGSCDRFFALLFIANVAIMAALTFIYGVDTAAPYPWIQPNMYLSVSETTPMIRLGVLLAFSAFAIALSIAKLFTTWPHEAAKLVLSLGCVGVAAIAVSFFMGGETIGGYGSVAVAVYCLLSMRFFTQRFGFIVANLRVVGAAIGHYPSLYVVAFVSTAIQIVWMVACVLAFLGVATQLKLDREATFVTELKPGGATCSANSECASGICVTPVSSPVRVCDGSTGPMLKAGGEQCTFGSECESDWCVSYNGAPRTCRATPTAALGNSTDGQPCSKTTDCVSRKCVSKTIHTNASCADASEAHHLSGPSARDYAALTAIAISSYWGVVVIKNVVHATTAGVVASIWHGAAPSTVAMVQRSVTSSLGAICLGSFLLATCTAMLTTLGRTCQSFLGTYAHKIASILEGSAQFFNRWAFVYVSVYGHSFAHASTHVVALFDKRGLGEVIEADLAGRVVQYAAMGIAAACFFLSFPLGSVVSVDASSLDGVGELVGLVAGLGIAMTPLAVVDSALATIYVCFAEDPHTFAVSHPDLYQELVREWHKLYPDAMAKGGYYLPSSGHNAEDTRQPPQ